MIGQEHSSHEGTPEQPSGHGFRELLARVRGGYSSLPAAERRVGDAVIADPEALIRLPLKEMAVHAAVSEATVVRFCQSLGYDGLRALKRELVARALSSARVVYEGVESDDDVGAIVEKVFRSNISALSDTLALLDRDALAAAVDAILDASRVECYAVGASIPVALDAYYRLLRLGLPATAVTDSHMQATSAANLPAGSVVFAVSHFGRSFEMHSALNWAKRAGATCILLTSFSGTPVGELANLQLIVAAPESSLRPEAVATRIAHLAVVDALSVALALKRPQAASDALLRDYEVISEREVGK